LEIEQVWQALWMRHLWKQLLPEDSQIDSMGQQDHSLRYRDGEEEEDWLCSVCELLETVR
jgi:hypothetical protein